MLDWSKLPIVILGFAAIAIGAFLYAKVEKKFWALLLLQLGVIALVIGLLLMAL